MRLPAQLLPTESAVATEAPAISWSAPSALRLVDAGAAAPLAAPVAATVSAPAATPAVALTASSPMVPTVGVSREPVDHTPVAKALHTAGFTRAALVVARQAANGSDDEFAAIATADEALARTLEAEGTAGVPSVQIRENGQPRFIVSHGDSASLATAFTDEHDGNGVDAELRLFIDEAMAPGDFFVDYAPGFGFAALTAATARDGRVVAYADSASDAEALRTSARLSGCADRVTVGEMGTEDSYTLPDASGLVFVHAGGSANVAPLMQALRAADPAVGIDVVAWRCGTEQDAEYDAEGMHIATAVLGVLGFQHFALAEGAQGVELVPADAVATNTMIFSVGAAFLARGAA